MYSLATQLLSDVYVQCFATETSLFIAFVYEDERTFSILRQVSSV